MPQNGYSIGRDVTLNVITADGVLPITGVTSFQSKQDTTEEKVKRIDGEIDHVRFFEGWSGRFMVERRDSTPDRYFNQIEANYFAGVEEGEVTITETITEESGSVSQYRYRKVLLKFEDGGEWAGDKTVKMTVSFIASRRITIA